MKRTIWQVHDLEFTRRTLLRLAALAPIAGTARAAEQEFVGKSVTFASWGGSFQDAPETRTHPSGRLRLTGFATGAARRAAPREACGALRRVADEAFADAGFAVFFVLDL